MKICPVGAELFHADGRTDMTKLMVAFRNFAVAPKSISSTNFRFLSFADNEGSVCDHLGLHIIIIIIIILYLCRVFTILYLKQTMVLG
jgi:hypothetical protein